MAVMAPEPTDILVLERRIARDDLVRLLRLFGDMVKYVVDVERGVVALGGEFHADAEQGLLGQGSRPADLWGANYYSRRPRADPPACRPHRPGRRSGSAPTGAAPLARPRGRPLRRGCPRSSLPRHGLPRPSPHDGGGVEAASAPPPNLSPLICWQRDWPNRRDISGPCLRRGSSRSPGLTRPPASHP